jgi:Na+-transporting methylmalonyl-CoA/oxaloacetate decarboxylase gamma subunit
VSWWSQVSGTVLQGLEITIVGMLLVFFTLGLIIVALVLLTRLPGLRTVEDKKEIQEPSAEPQVAVSAPPPVMMSDELGQVAAIAVALIRSQRQVRVRPKAQAAGGRWRGYSRLHQLGL